MAGVIRGRLADSGSAPGTGEIVERLTAAEDVVIEHILSGQLEVPVDYVQDHDEWVMVLEGSAEVDLDDESLSLTPGDWLLLPRGTPHRLVQTSSGTSWLAVRFNARRP